MKTVQGNLLSLDVGEKRVGIALAEVPTFFARPLTTLSNNDQLSEKITDLARQYEIKTIVVGYPRNQSGEPTEQTKAVESTVQTLQFPETIKLAWQDESLTSVKAEAELQSRKKSYEKGDIDSLAATFILEDYIKECA